VTAVLLAPLPLLAALLMVWAAPSPAPHATSAAVTIRIE
jgi:hypothetical protein